MEKQGSVKIVDGKFVGDVGIGYKIDGDNDGQPCVELELAGKAKIDVAEALSELTKTTDSELLKKILPMAETLVTLGMTAASKS